MLFAALNDGYRGLERPLRPASDADAGVLRLGWDVIAYRFGEFDGRPALDVHHCPRRENPSVIRYFSDGSYTVQAFAGYYNTDIYEQLVTELGLVPNEMPEWDWVCERIRLFHQQCLSPPERREELIGHVD